MLEIQNVGKRYGRVIAINEINLNIAPGTIAGVVGAPGSGKTTLLQICAGLERPTVGDVRLFGVSATQNINEVRRLTGFVPSAPGVYPDMSCAEFLRFFATCHGVPVAQQPQLIADLLQLVDLYHRRDDSTEVLSPGMRRRLGVARAMVHDPALLVLDDFTEWLDPRARVDLRDMVVNLGGMGKIVLMSGRVIADLRDMCTNLIMLEKGRVVDVTGAIDSADPAARRMIVVKYLGDVEIADQLATAAKDVVSVRQMQPPAPRDAQQTALNQLKEMHIVFGGTYASASELLRVLMHSGVQIVGFSEEAQAS
jgi:ABC-2 type transport system ATP-binding protein